MHQVSLVKHHHLHVTKSNFDVRAVPDAPKRRKPEVKRARVEEATKWLNSRSRLHPEKSRLNLYLEKRAAHEKSNKHKDDSYKEALEMSKRDPRNENADDQRASYDRWVAENHRRLNAAIQATHMDWVTTANKTDVEYHLGLIDLDLNKAITKVLETQVSSFFASCADNVYLSHVALQEAHTLEGRELAS